MHYSSSGIKRVTRPPKNLCNEVFKKIESEENLDLILVILRTTHNSDFARFLKNDKTFKDYVKGCVHFESRIHFPGKKPSRFMISSHFWYALRIVKNGTNHNLRLRDIYYFR